MSDPRNLQAPGGRHPHVRRVFLAITASVSALVMVVGALGFGLYLYARGAESTIPPEPSAGPGRSQAPQAFTGRCAERSCNYLLLGSDSRTGLSKAEQEANGTNADIGGSNRSDTIILVHTQVGQKQATFLSFPRDLWVDIPGMGSNKINAAFEGGIKGFGAQRVARTVTALTGIRIDHVLYVDLAGFEQVVNALGGVEMCVPYPMVDPLTQLDIPAGCQHFDGKTALAYVRTRHQKCDTIPDFARISRQQQFLRAVLAKVLRPSEILRLPGLIRPILHGLVVDAGLNPAELAYLAGQLQGVSTGNADFRTVPSTPAWDPLNGVMLSTVHLVQPQANELFAKIRNNAPLGDLGLTQEQTPPSPAVISTAVYARGAGVVPGPSPSSSPSAGASGSATPGTGTSTAASTAAKTVFDTLTKAGFNTAPGLQPLSAIGDVPRTGTVIFFNPKAIDGQAMADVVKGYLSNVDVVAAPKHLLPVDVDVAVVVAPGYTLPPPSTSEPVDCSTA